LAFLRGNRKRARHRFTQAFLEDPEGTARQYAVLENYEGTTDFLMLIASSRDAVLSSAAKRGLDTMAARITQR
jgi:hypothetical protein